MQESDLAALGEKRRLIFSNVANGVPDENIMAAFHISREQILREVDFVSRKIKEYRFRRGIPLIACETVQDIRYNRLALFETLGKLGNKYLSSSLLIPSIKMQKLDHPSMVDEATHRMKISNNG